MNQINLIMINVSLTLIFLNKMTGSKEGIYMIIVLIMNYLKEKSRFIKKTAKSIMHTLKEKLTYMNILRHVVAPRIRINAQNFIVDVRTMTQLLFFVIFLVMMTCKKKKLLLQKKFYL
ncbi:hypothetical protein PVNG_05797 [Plasmodium vivax North Korean]|uniref:Uncharacterized protein n=1 Tax=Plasmodium vivax North Korean TaxID=1035514 RepID=A0A0J9TLY0_PLAVI|nr:hypothetical protein PVNG_05797 [Plasmodium vivax North Korean]